MIRLDKYLADTGAASRREAKMYIRRGEVTVDGVPAAAPEQKVSETAVVCLRGQPLHYQTYHYYMLHKPSGVLTATSDRSQPTVLDLFPPELQRFGLVPAGRLDKDTTGLLLITDDGTMIRTPADGISEFGRSASGVIVMRVAEGSTIANFAITGKAKEEEAENTDPQEADTTPDTDTIEITAPEEEASSDTPENDTEE